VCIWKVDKFSKKQKEKEPSLGELFILVKRRREVVAIVASARSAVEAGCSAHTAMGGTNVLRSESCEWEIVSRLKERNHRQTSSYRGVILQHVELLQANKALAKRNGELETEIARARVDNRRLSEEAEKGRGMCDCEYSSPTRERGYSISF
tara:strand:- start:73 stop:525 length:453 start_codon:yes stop_codon:yes gene_type:complete